MTTDIRKRAEELGAKLMIIPEATHVIDIIEQAITAERNRALEDAAKLMMDKYEAGHVYAEAIRALKQPANADNGGV